MKKIRKNFSNYIKYVLNKFPYVSTLHKLNSNSKFPAGHFYSSVVSLADMAERQDYIWPMHIDKKISDIDLNESQQLRLFEKLSQDFDKLGISENKEKGYRYFFKNSYFSYGDGMILGSLMKSFKPKRIIEIGSGFSSALMLDINVKFLMNKTQLTFIEPYPTARLNHILSQGQNENVRKIEEMIQTVNITEFKKLDKGDILFVDSSHIVKTGSDVNHILFHILPVLKSGVIIHFHDIYYPFEYPKKWVLNGIGWNEIYFLRSFLMNNNSYEILLFSDFLLKFHKDKIENYPLFLKSPGSSFWFRKL
jgi:hypothetical protein